MKKTLLLALILLLSTFSLLTCARIKEPDKGDLKTIKLSKLDAIPTEYGSVVGITANPKFPGWAQLWFKGNDETIRIVSVGVFNRTINENVIIIPRY